MRHSWENGVGNSLVLGGTWGDDDAAFAWSSETIGEGELSTEYRESSKLAAEADDSIGLVTEGCVKLGEEETRDSWSSADGVVTVVVVIEGAGGCERVIVLVTIGVGLVSVEVVAVVGVAVVGCETALFAC